MKLTRVCMHNVTFIQLNIKSNIPQAKHYIVSQDMNYVSNTKGWGTGVGRMFENTMKE